MFIWSLRLTLYYQCRNSETPKKTLILSIYYGCFTSTFCSDSVDAVCPVNDEADDTADGGDSDTGGDADGDGSLYMCKTCGAGFKRSPDFARHMKVHAPRKPLKCDVYST